MKRFLISIIIGFIGLISFGDCLIVEPITSGKRLDGNSSMIASPGFCYKLNSTYYQYFKFTENGSDYTLPSNAYTYCFGTTGTVTNINSNQVNYTFYDISSILGSNYTSEECQQQYSLMPIDSCDSEYCEMNNLCEVIGGSGSSTLYINDIWHESAPFIYVNIPEEFARDYYTGEQEFTINVSGYNTDSDYIAGIINTQKSTPNDVDLNNIISGVLPLFVPGLVIILFIRFVFRFIKKIF